MFQRIRHKRLVRAYRRQFRNTYCRAAEQRRGRTSGLIGLTGLLFGLSLLAVPVVSDVMTSQNQQQDIQEVQATYEPSSNPKIRAAIAQAKKYNAALAGRSFKGRVLPYDKQLEFEGNSSNAWIEIPAIGVNLPIYKGATEQTLAAGVGHLPGTSLPVGGKPSNCVLTAHSGMPNSRMFDDIRNLQKGDRMVVHTLGYSFAYEMEYAEVVLPQETDHLEIYRKDEDMLTLVTCTPYGVNDHRLLVHCKRVPYDPNAEDGQPSASPRTDLRALPLIIAAVAAAGIPITLTLRSYLRRRNRHGKRKPSRRRTAPRSRHIPFHAARRAGIDPETARCSRNR